MSGAGSSTNRAFYARRLERVLRHVARNLRGDLRLESLSRVAGFSKFHFHRQFRAYVGMPVGQWIGLARLKQASYQLAFAPELRVIDIALGVGFETPEAFSRAFKRTLGQAPSSFRSGPDWERWTEVFGPVIQRGERAVNVDIVDFPTTPIAVLEHRGAPSTVMRSVQRFIAWRKSCDASPNATSETYALAYDDPDTTPPDEYRLDICGSVRCDVPTNPYGVVESTIPGGRCAVARHVGSTDSLRDTVQALFREWLPESGESPRDFPLFFHHLKRMPTTEEHEQVTDVYLPLE